MARAKAATPSLTLVPAPSIGFGPAAIADAEAFCRAQRLAFAKWLSIDDAALNQADRQLAARVLETTTGDGAAYDKALAHPRVGDLFAVGALSFARPA